MKQLYLICLALLLLNRLDAQDPKDLTFMLSGWGTFGWSVEDIGEEGYIISGHTEYPGFNKELLTKTNKYGDTAWVEVIRQSTASAQAAEENQTGRQSTKDFLENVKDGTIGLTINHKQQEVLWQKVGPAFAPHGRDVELTNDGGYILFGTYNVGLNNGFHLIKLNNSGDTLWTQTYYEVGKSNEGMGISQTRDDGYIFTGSSHDLGADRWEMALVKTNNVGEITWQKAYGSTKFEIGSDARQTKDGGYIVTGQASRTVDGVDKEKMFLMKTDAGGRKSWMKTFGYGLYSEGSSVRQTEDGGYIIAGLTSLEDDEYTTGRNICLYVVKTDYKGIMQWDHIFPNTNSDERMAVQQTPDGGYLIRGKLRPILHVFKLNNDGEPLWETDIDLANTIEIDPNPFTEATTISYDLKLSAQVELSVYSAGGVRVAELVSEKQEEGIHSYPFNPDTFGYGTGDYLVKLKIGDQSFTSKMIKEPKQKE